MAQNAPRDCRSVTRSLSAGLKLLLCALVLVLGTSIGRSQPVPDTTLRPDLPEPTWNGLCSLSVGGAVVHWAVGDSGKVLKSVCGDTSTEYTIGKGQFDLTGVSFADAKHGWVVGSKREDPGRGRGVIFSTTTGGERPKGWIASCPVIRPDDNVPFLKVQAMDIRHVWVTCGDGYMLYSNDGGANWAVTAKRPRPAEPGTSGSNHEK